jgi:hypothetical protein
MILPMVHFSCAFTLRSREDDETMLISSLIGLAFGFSERLFNWLGLD